MPSPARIVLAPMEGLADDVLRDVLTGLGGYDWCVTEFIRVTGTVLPLRTFRRVSPELCHGARTAGGTPVRAQLLGSDPGRMALSAARLATLQPFGIDLNFGCPAPTVNRHRGGAALLEEPHLLHDIAAAVRAAVPAGMAVTAKMRLGLGDAGRAVECAQALAEGGAGELVVHARTRAQCYRPPAHWTWIARIAAAVPVPVIANGDVWTAADWRRCRAECGAADVMLGRGAVSDPLLAQRLRGARAERPEPADWQHLMPAIGSFWRQVCRKLNGVQAPGRLKQWLGMLARTYPQAGELLAGVRPLKMARDVDAVLLAAGILAHYGAPERAAA